MENMNNLVFNYDSSEHGSLMKKVVGVISQNKEIELPYPFQKQTTAPVETVLHSLQNKTVPLWVGFWQRWAMPPFQNCCCCCLCRICPCCLSGRSSCPAELPSLGIIKVWFIWVWKEVRSIQFARLPPCISLESLRIGGVVIFPFHCGSQCLKTGELFFLGSWLLHCLEKFASVYTELNYFEPFQFPFFALLSHVVAGILVIVTHLMTWSFWMLGRGPGGALCGSKPSKFCFCPWIFLLQVNAAVLSNSSCVFLCSIARVY